MDQQKVLKIFYNSKREYLFLLSDFKFFRWCWELPVWKQDKMVQERNYVFDFLLCKLVRVFSHSKSEFFQKIVFRILCGSTCIMTLYTCFCIFKWRFIHFRLWSTSQNFICTHVNSFAQACKWRNWSSTYALPLKKCEQKNLLMGSLKFWDIFCSKGHSFRKWKISWWVPTSVNEIEFFVLSSFFGYFNDSILNSSSSVAPFGKDVNIVSLDMDAINKVSKRLGIDLKELWIQDPEECKGVFQEQ